MSAASVIITLYVRRHLVEKRLRVAQIKERQDMRMQQIGGRLDLGQEAFTTYYGSQFRLQDLERNLPLVTYVLGQVDRSHPAFPKLMLDAVAALKKIWKGLPPSTALRTARPPPYTGKSYKASPL